MARGFLSQKRSRGGRGVKEKEGLSADNDELNEALGMFSSSTGLFSFQFSSIDGLDAMLENGPWFIRNNPLILKKWHPDDNILKENVSIVPLWVKIHGVPVTAFSEDGFSAIATKLGTLLMLDSYTSDMCMQSWGRSSYAQVMVELRADVELKDNIFVAMPKITREGHYTCNVLNLKKIRPVPTKPNASSSGNKKNGVEPTIEATNLVNNEATSSGSSFMNIDNDEEFTSNTLIGEKIDKIERQIGKGKLRMLDNDGNPLVPTGIVESDSEVEMVFDETVNLRISTSGKDESDKGYGTNILLEQWRYSYPDNDDYDSYDDDMYGNHDLSVHLQSICDDHDITATNLVNNEATSSGSSFMNIDNDEEFTSNTLIGEKIDKIERQIGKGKLRMLDNDGNPLVLTGIVESDSEVEMVFDETVNLRISTSGKDESDKGYGTNILLEQWRYSYPDNDDYDSYDDDMYGNHDLSVHLQSICDDLDITVRGRKKK
nr:hypothetical protein [Tanacetum cinerariifolium]